MRACACSLSPAATTTPAPSLPIGNVWSKRDLIRGNIPLWTGALKVDLSSLNVAFDRSAGPNIGHISDGLIGDASIFTTISWAFGFGTSISRKLICNSPSDDM